LTDDSRPIFVAKGVGAFFGFLLLFFGVSTYLGGGITGIAVSVFLAVGVALGLLLLWPRLRQQSHHPNVPVQVPPQPPVKPKESKQECPPGPYAVISDAPTKIRLNVEAGDRIDGYLEEIDGDYFDWYVVDEDNMIRCLNGDDFDHIDGDENVHASKVKCKIPHDGPWYLMLDLEMRRYDRKVEVNLRVIRN